MIKNKQTIIRRILFAFTAIVILLIAETTHAQSQKILKTTHAPSTPLNFLATPNSNNNIDLQWRANLETDITSYSIYKNTTYNTTTATLVTTVGSSVTKFTDYTLDVHVIYYYWVTATNNHSISSAFSNVDTAMIKAPSNPPTTTGTKKEQIMIDAVYPNPTNGMVTINL